MTNEEMLRNKKIRKYVKGLYKKQIYQLLVLWLLGSIGLWIACPIAFMSNRLDIYQNIAIYSIVILTVIKWIVVINKINKIEDKIRDSIYHLIRKDERERISSEDVRG